MSDPVAPLLAAAAAFTGALAPEPLEEFALTDLDAARVPVWQAWWRGPSPTGGIGYGPTVEQARVGALGEAVEQVASHRALGPRPRRTASYDELRAERGADRVVDPRRLGLPAGTAYDGARPLQWLPARRWSDGEEVLVPAEMVASSGSELPGPPPAGGWLTVPVTNGMGAGTSLAQAVTHAVLEVLQRDGNGLVFRALDRGVVLDLDEVRDHATHDALGRLAAAGVQVLPKLATTERGLPNVYVVGTAPGDDVVVATACGEAVHPDREVALRKAVLEFASARARKRFMHGPLDAVAAVAPAGYLDAVLPTLDPAAEEPRVLGATLAWLDEREDAWRPRLERTVLAERERVPFSALATSTPPDLLADVLGRLAADEVVGDVLVADLSPGAGVHAAKVVVPGTEVETVAYGRVGERGVARLRDLGRDDLARVGADPGGWARVALVPEAEERLGGPAWVDRTALSAVADGLLPLYREPGRHTAQLARAAR